MISKIHQDKSLSEEKPESESLSAVSFVWDDYHRQQVQSDAILWFTLYVTFAQKKEDQQKLDSGWTRSGMN